MIEALRLTSGKLLLSAGPHCVETDADDRSLELAIDELAGMSGTDRIKIAVVVARETLIDG